MAGGMDLGGGGKGGKKPLDASINLTPFIDLMAVTISFLLLTAVWTQIGKLQVSQAGGPSTEETPPTETKTVQLTLAITPEEMRLSADQSTFDPIPISRDESGKLDLAKLTARFKEIREQFPDQSAITLQTDDKVRYDILVRIIDECMGSGLPQVSVMAAG
ncbi:ExbD/TolR family protein [Stigmatella erecta]|uniref:Biopolymer transport protein ExbD n=1 Tax=Stigmatella erecta TaxID=83460 RepID=A0A1I0LD66_9BACT|nr:biopolymer transporter ExbD [Stigmatella erecta]SEU37513.1 Biopolymer transport protein ExbD [Stigmatella erecta]